jgi:hypothetical protein
MRWRVDVFPGWCVGVVRSIADLSLCLCVLRVRRWFRWRATTRIFPGFKPCYKNLLVNRAYYNSSDSSVAPSPQSLSSTVNSPALFATPASAPASGGATAPGSAVASSLTSPRNSSASPQAQLTSPRAGQPMSGSLASPRGVRPGSQGPDQQVVLEDEEQEETEDEKK